MNSFFKYILPVLLTVLMSASCLKELEMDQPLPDNSELALVPRVRSFANQYVTKAGYTGNETRISNLSVLVFNNDGNLVHIIQGGTGSVTLNKSMLEDRTQSGKLTASTVVMIANISLDSVTKADGTSINDNRGSLTLDDMENYTFHLDEGKSVITDISSDTFAGFPMIGGVKGIDLTPTTTQQSAVEIGMKILYAKINFAIGVAAGTENQSTGQGSGIQFNLTGYSVHNTSAATTVAVPAIKGKQPVDFLGNTIEDSEASDVDVATASAAYEYPATAGAFGGKTGTAILEGDPITFTFYVSENRYNHNSDLKGIYPSNDWLISATDAYDEDVKGYTGMSESDKTKNPLNGVKYFYDDVIQQYKPKLANVSSGRPAAGKATYVLLNGTYTDYRGAVWTVNYKAYLGKDNAHNFHVDRNSEYTNNITIKGIRNNDSHNGEGQVWIDHRVNVTDASNAANHVGITRETLIDSHIEVRPLRVSWPGGEYVGVRVYLPTNSDGSLVDWIGIERFTGENNNESTTYCYHNGKSIGKRKYFTTSLISELQSKDGEFGVRTDEDSGRKYVYLLNGECAWIYFDEYTSTTQREAEIELEFYPESGSPTTTKYIVKQRGLCSIAGYKLESYEEYLHTYDSEDKYNLSTSPADYTRQGLAWGFVKETISEDIIISATQLEIQGANLQNYISQRYDYFHKSDIPAGETYYPYIKNGNDWVAASYGTGLDFTERASVKEDITVKDMGTIPDNAYQYCLSKNKFTADEEGNINMKIHWYLPDVYELQAVLGSTQTAEDFDASSYYWSSQPSNDGFSINIPIINREVSIKNEDENNARAVSKNGNTNINRALKHRIRCFYDATGIATDMDGRTPDGVGGNFNFYMKAYNGNDAGYFNYMLSNATTAPDNGTTHSNNYGDENLEYPTFDNPGSEFDYFSNAVDQNGNTVQGFGKNPALQSNWSVYSALGQTFYYTLYNFTGLSEYTMDNATFADASRPTTTKKAKVNIKSTKTRKSLQSSLVSASLNPLDHLTNGDMLKISFSNDKNASYSPIFTFSELINESKEVTTTQYWQVPTYNEKKYTPKPVETSVSAKDIEGAEASSYIASYAQQNAQDNAKKAAYAAAKKEANEKYNGHTELSVSYSDLVLVAGYPKTVNRRDTYKYKCTCTLAISLSGEKTYYLDATGGGWDNGTSVTKYIDGIETDELRMYCGNSLTISLADKYKSSYEITKVKIYYSGNNLLYKGGGFLGIGEDEVYTRFVDNEIHLPTDIVEIPYGGSAETLQLPGMDYNEDNSTGKGYHQWTGDGRNSVTLVLADYFVNDQGGSRKYTYQYKGTAQYPNEYIIIDKIEVKCTPKSTE